MKPWCPTVSHEEEDAAEADAVHSGEDVELGCLRESGLVPGEARVVGGSSASVLF